MSVFLSLREQHNLDSVRVPKLSESDSTETVGLDTTEVVPGSLEDCRTGSYILLKHVTVQSRFAERAAASPRAPELSRDKGPRVVESPHKSFLAQATRRPKWV